MNGPKAGRAERRVPLVVPVLLTSPEHGGLVEWVATQNVSSFGARVVSEHEWQPDQRLLIESQQYEFRSKARVVYCKPVQGGKFVVGLRLSSAAANWLANISNVA